MKPKRTKCVCVTDGFCESVSRDLYACTREQGHTGDHVACLCDEQTGTPDRSKAKGHKMATWKGSN